MSEHDDVEDDDREEEVGESPVLAALATEGVAAALAAAERIRRAFDRSLALTDLALASAPGSSSARRACRTTPAARWSARSPTPTDRAAPGGLRLSRLQRDT